MDEKTKQFLNKVKGVAIIVFVAYLMWVIR